MPQWLGTQQKRTQVPLSLNAHWRFMIWQWECFQYLGPQSLANKPFSQSILQHRAVQDPYANNSQCQGDGCSLSSKDSASCATILELAVNDHCCPKFLVNFRPISAEFIMWSLSIAILPEFGLSLFSSYTFTHSFNEVLSLQIVSMYSRWKAWCPQGADQFHIDLCRGYVFL